MKFIVGLLAGTVLGAVAAVAYSVQTGRDLREEYEGVRSDLSRRDLDALGARLESRVTELQAVLETRMSEVRERASSAMHEADVTAAEAAAEVAASVEAAAETAATAAETAADQAGA
jgi:gas vesicle protein